MIVTIVVIDQLLWRPLVAWAEKFKLEQTEGKDNPTSWVLDLLQAPTYWRGFPIMSGARSALLRNAPRCSARISRKQISGHTPAPAKSVLRVAYGESSLLGIAWLVVDALEYREGDQNRHEWHGDAPCRSGSACSLCCASLP